jgi:15-cis-phytoene synthase
MTLSTASLPDIGSASHHAASDDRLKDTDNLAFLRGQPEGVQLEWLARCKLLRRLDRMAEAERAGGGDRFTRFLEAWWSLRWADRGTPDADIAGELAVARELWLSPPDDAAAQIRTYALTDYLHAVTEYSDPGLQLATLRDHDRLLGRVSGSMFQLFPYVSPERLPDIARFGSLDQAWNNIRDLAEDARAGSCFFPAETLRDYGVRWWDVITGEAIGKPLFRNMMTWWLGDYLPAVRARAAAFLSATDLHPSVAALRASCLRRYERVERVLRGLDWDYRAFPAVYEAEVKREIGEMAMGGGVKEIA